MGNELPSGWRTLSVEQIASSKPYSCVGGPFGSSLTTKHYVESPGVPVIRGNNLSTTAHWMLEEGFVFVSDDKADQLERNSAYPGDIVFTQRGTLGQVVRIRPNSSFPRFIVSQSQMKLTVAEHLADPDYVTQYFRSPIGQRSISLATTATGVPHINLSSLKKFVIPVPPLAEQRKIAAILGAVDQAIDKTQAVIDQVQVVKKALMQDLLTRGLPGRHTRFKQTDIGELPESWSVCPLAELADVERGKFSHRPRNDPDFYGGPHPFVQTGDVAACDGYITRYSQTLNDRGLSVSRIFPAGTIVVTIAAHIGETGIASFDVSFPDSLVGIIAGDRMDRRFLRWVLESRKSALEKSATESAQKNINLQTLRPLPIQVPCLQEQREIGEQFDALVSRSRCETGYLEALQTLKQSLMSVLLTGEVRVPLEPTP